jgi:hypothetical protein
MARRVDPNQLDFFDRLAEPLPPPVWGDLPGFEHTDFIPERERCTLFLFAAEAPRRPLVAGVLAGFAALRSAGPLRDQAFTVYLGERGPEDERLFAVGLAVTDRATVRVFEEHLPPRNLEAGDAASLAARFRYDHGHAVEYVGDAEQAGTAWMDHGRRYGSGLLVHRRLAIPGAGVGRPRGAYARLR